MKNIELTNESIVLTKKAVECYDKWVAENPEAMAEISCSCIQKGIDQARANAFRDGMTRGYWIGGAAGVASYLLAPYILKGVTKICDYVRQKRNETEKE